MRENSSAKGDLCNQGGRPQARVKISDVIRDSMGSAIGFRLPKNLCRAELLMPNKIFETSALPL